MEVVQKVIADNNLSHFQQAINADPDYNFWVESHKKYEDLKQEWQTRPLWTVAGNSVFASNNTSGGNLVINNAWLASEFLMGINNAKSSVNMEMDILAIDSMSNSGLGKSIDRNVFALEPGINFVIKSGRNAARSVFEFKLSGTYYHTFSTPYKYEEQNRSSINATLRLRIIDDTWIPVTFKLDDKGHVYGFIDFKFNFTTLANVATQYAQRAAH